MTADALLQDAFAHHGAGRLVQAEALYRDVLLHEQDNLNALQLLGAIASDTNRYGEAIACLDRAASVLQARGAPGAQHATLYYNLGNALAAAGRRDEAAARYRIGLTLDPSMALLWARLADVLNQAGDTAGAASALHAALQRDPAQPDWLLLLGTIHARSGRQAEAADLFCRVLALQPGRAEARRALGLLLMSDDMPGGTIDAAASCLARDMALHPGDAETHWMLGRVAESRGDPAAAEAAYRQALRQQPDLPAALFDLGTLLYRERKQPDQAVALFDRLIAAVPDHVGVHCARGNALRALRRIDQALESYQRYLALEPLSALAHLRLGEALAEAGRTREAVASFTRALQFQDGNDVAYLARVGLGNALAALEQIPEAMAQYRVALALQPLATHKAAKSPPDFAALLIMAAAGNNTPYEYLTERVPFETGVLLMVPDQAYDEAFLAAHADVIVNLVSDVDRDNGMLPVAAALIDRLGRPVINHPSRILATDRDSIAALLSGIPGCRVPRVERQRGAALLAPGCCALRDRGAPFLARLAGCHGGDAFERIDAPDDLRRLVSRQPDADYFLIEYIDYRSADGYFRKYRFFIVGEAILPYHLAIGDDWKVHHYTTDMANQPWMRREEEAFLNAPGTVFKPRHFAALRAMRDAIGLDFLGVDCALDRNGNVVVFEANATMLVHADSGDFAYKNPHVERIKAAFVAMLAQARGTDATSTLFPNPVQATA